MIPPTWLKLPIIALASVLISSSLYYILGFAWLTTYFLLFSEAATPLNDLADILGSNLDYGAWYSIFFSVFVALPVSLLFFTKKNSLKERLYTFIIALCFLFIVSQFLPWKKEYASLDWGLGFLLSIIVFAILIKSRLFK